MYKERLLCFAMQLPTLPWHSRGSAPNLFGSRSPFPQDGRNTVSLRSGPIMSQHPPINSFGFSLSALPSCPAGDPFTSTSAASISVVPASTATPELYENLPVPYLTLTPDGIIQSINPIGAAHLGSSTAALIGQSFLTSLPPDEQAVFAQILVAMVTTPSRLESWRCRLLVADGRQIWVNMTAQTGRYAGTMAIALVFHNISDLYLQAQRSNATLERQVRQRTAQLQLAFNCEATLKRITDRVRDSLDEDQILDTAVRELACGLGMQGCNAAMFDLSQGTSTIYYEYTVADCRSERRVSHIDDFPELYHQILRGHHFQFCSLLPNPRRGQVALFACPIRDDRGVLGSLWLTNHSYYGFNEQDIRLVEQVANQCAIAIRQARLYQAAQAQVAQLERLNQLKDDFLSTISHELRTPVTSMRMALQMLGVSLNQELSLFAELSKPQAQQSRTARYFQILHHECDREIRLIDDLLYLQQSEVDSSSSTRDAIRLSDWLAPLVESFRHRAHEKQQTLKAHVPPSLPLLHTNAQNLQRIVTELLENACKYSPNHARIQVNVLATATTLTLRVSNTGVTIPANELPHVFDMFYRVPSSDPWKQGGTGLGLALVKRLVARLGGAIWVESQEQDTQFTVELPLSVDRNV
jgi:PAS domain S-box-containing protein